MKILILILLAFISEKSLAFTWTAEVQDAETHEIKTYKFTEAKLYKIEMPSLKVGGCGLLLQEPTDSGMKNDTKAQLAEVHCISPDSGFIAKKVCIEGSEPFNASPLMFQFVDESDKMLKKQPKKKIFRSYQITLKCE